MASNDKPETSNGVKRERIDDVEEETITLGEYIEEVKRLETTADAVLGPSDDKNCTYVKGYVKRQALYACKTCTPSDQEDSKPAGICLACSYHCHEGHDLVELYTKRNFKCDCGNSLFKENKCNLDPAKSSVNESNQYNHNFKGVYCTCLRPYPDPDEADESDFMLQCVVCEDWFHSRHLECEVPSDDFAEMICGQCTNRLHFLQYYLGYAITKINKDSTEQEVQVNCEAEAKPQEKNSASEPEGAAGEEPQKAAEPATTANQECIRSRTKPLDRTGGGATFWPENFRSLLCKCSSCLALYESLGVAWIIDPADTVLAYESTANPDSDRANKGNFDVLKWLSGLDRVTQVETIQNYNDLKSNLMEFLEEFAKNKKVVREEDIKEFFTHMKAKKRQRVSDMPPYMCR